MDPHDDPDVDLGRVLFELAPRLTRLENAVLKEMTPPLTFRQYRILLRVSEGTTSLTALGRTATISLPAISESVDGLVQRGLLRRKQEAADRRAARLQLTVAGEAALRAAGEVLAGLSRDLLAGLSADQRETVAAFLRAVTQRVTDRLTT